MHVCIHSRRTFQRGCVTVTVQIQPEMTAEPKRFLFKDILIRMLLALFAFYSSNRMKSQTDRPRHIDLEDLTSNSQSWKKKLTFVHAILCNGDAINTNFVIFFSFLSLSFF